MSDVKPIAPVRIGQTDILYAQGMRAGSWLFFTGHEASDFENGIAVGNDCVTIALFKGKPSPETIDHMSFHLPDMTTLQEALAHLKSIGADIEDPGDEIGPEAPGSKNMGLWFHDPDGYRWELSVLGGK